MFRKVLCLILNQNKFKLLDSLKVPHLLYIFLSAGLGTGQGLLPKPMAQGQPPFAPLSLISLKQINVVTNHDGIQTAPCRSGSQKWSGAIWGAINGSPRHRDTQRDLGSGTRRLGDSGLRTPARTRAGLAHYLMD